MKRAALLIFFVLLFDQVVKIWIKTHMFLGQEIRIFDWFIIHYTQNNGMAFGYEIEGIVFLIIFSIVASCVIGWYLVRLIKSKAHASLIISFALIFAGAVGSIIWLIIQYTQNNGMAFGDEFGRILGKLFLSIFRIAASGVIGWYLVRLIKRKAHPSLIISFALIFAGAVGNIIDSTFYGLVFSEDIDGISKFMSGPGYGQFLQGQVVDMLYFPLIDTHWPSWFPVIGGKSLQFFKPVFNIADSSITVGVLLFILFQKKFSEKPKEETFQQENSDITSDNNV